VNDRDGGTLQFRRVAVRSSPNPKNGQITGTATAAGNYNVTISVFDGLVTVFRSFVWTIGDVTPPILAVTSHVSGQSMSQAGVTIRGTATDFGAGGSGVSSVTINGHAAAGGAATANGIASCHTFRCRAALNISLQAADSAGNADAADHLEFRTTPSASTSSSTSRGPMKSASAINLTNPRLPGNRVTFTASGATGAARISIGGISATLEYGSSCGAGTCRSCVWRRRGEQL
jgi:hypothetical protein